MKNIFYFIQEVNVGLGSRLKNMVKFKGDALAVLAVDPGASENFVQLLSEREVWLPGLSAELPGGVDNAWEPVRNG